MRSINPLLEYLPPKAGDSFFLSEFDSPYFATPWHYHAEIELVYIVESTGKRFVGNSISDFKSGDLSLLGSNLPHLYQNPHPYYQNDSEYRAKSIVLHFLPSSLGPGFFNLPETNKVALLLEKAKLGMDITGTTKNQIVKKLHELLLLSGLKRIICLLEIIDILSNTTEYDYISKKQVSGFNESDATRLNIVLQYILQNYQQEVSLGNAAAKACMTRTSFCRYFKERTKRTFFEFIKELRLTHAAKLLQEEKGPVADAAYLSGYSSLTNFNRQFKEKFSLSPVKYRAQIKISGNEAETLLF